MILVLILLAVFILAILLVLLLYLSTLHIQIKNLEVSNTKQNNNSKYSVIFSLHLFNIIKWLSFHLNNKKMREYYSKIHLEKVDYNLIKNTFKLEDLKKLKKLEIKFSYLDFNLELGVENAVTTSILVASTASIISIILPFVAKKIDERKYKYKIVPIYQNDNLYKIKLNCIIEIKLVHIINIIYSVIKKGKSDKNERTSNRKPYDYSYE